MYQSKSVMAPSESPRKLKEPTKYPESETVQSDALSVAQMFERFNQDPQAMDNNYFDASGSEYMQRFLKPNLDLTDLDELSKFNAELSKKISDAKKQQKADKKAEKAEANKQLDIEEEANKQASKKSETKDSEDK